MLAAEASPFAKVGGLGDVIGSLPAALGNLGEKVSVIIPAYRMVLSGSFDLHPCGKVSGFDVPMKSDSAYASVYQTRFERTDVDIYLIESPRYFDRSGIYTDSETGDEYPDSMERYVFFMKSALELLPRLEQPVDILHCHDSHTSLIPGLLKINHRADPFYAGTRTLLTIHNIAYQGIYSKESLDYAGIDSSHFFPMSPFEYWGKVNFLKAGIELADKVNTVSRTYSMEIRTSPEFGMGMEEVLRRREDDISGIINGIDCNEWNPETDPLIPACYSIHDLSGKAECKKQLLQYFGMPQLPGRVPLIGIVSRLTDQKGFDLIQEAVGEITNLDLQLVVLGTGQPQYHSLFRQLASKYPQKIAARFSFDNALAHRIEAGSDMFLMPSRFEPCGLNQLYSFRYGTVPVVRATGGLADTVVPYGSGSGTGFSFSGYSSSEMMIAIRQALTVYSDPARWRALQIRIMSQDWSWDKPAREYVQLYRSIHL